MVGEGGQLILSMVDSGNERAMKSSGVSSSSLARPALGGRVRLFNESKDTLEPLRLFNLASKVSSRFESSLFKSAPCSNQLQVAMLR